MSVSGVEVREDKQGGRKRDFVASRDVGKEKEVARLVGFVAL